VRGIVGATWEAGQRSLSGSSATPHGKKFHDRRYELFKSIMEYDGEIGRQQHDFPRIEKLPG